VGLGDKAASRGTRVGSVEACRGHREHWQQACNRIEFGKEEGREKREFSRTDAMDDWTEQPALSDRAQSQLEG